MYQTRTRALRWFMKGRGGQKCLVFLICIQMKDQNELDRGLRKSNRQRVPNQFYTEGINELKRAPRPARDPQPKQSRKRSILYQDDGDNSEEDAMDEERSDLARDSNDWFPCRMPKTGQMMKVQFVLHQPDEPIVEKKKEEPAKTQKKADSTFDLLQLFQKAIVDVNEEIVHEKEPEPEALLKQPKIKKEFSIAKQRRVQDIQGRITNVQLLSDRMLIRHSKIGETQVPTMPSGQMQSESTIDRSEVQQYRSQLMHSNLLGQISIFN